MADGPPGDIVGHRPMITDVHRAEVGDGVSPCGDAADPFGRIAPVAAAVVLPGAVHLRLHNPGKERRNGHDRHGHAATRDHWFESWERLAFLRTTDKTNESFPDCATRIFPSFLTKRNMIKAEACSNVNTMYKNTGLIA
jgi:hypothetical protein